MSAAIKVLVLDIVPTALFWCGILLMPVMAIDALEWETTGKCTDCHILPLLADRFALEQATLPDLEK